MCLAPLSWNGHLIHISYHFLAKFRSPQSSLNQNQGLLFSQSQIKLFLDQTEVSNQNEVDK